MVNNAMLYILSEIVAANSLDGTLLVDTFSEINIEGIFSKNQVVSVNEGWEVHLGATVTPPTFNDLVFFIRSSSSIGRCRRQGTITFRSIINFIEVI